MPSLVLTSSDFALGLLFRSAKEQILIDFLGKLRYAIRILGEKIEKTRTLPANRLSTHDQNTLGKRLHRLLKYLFLHSNSSSPTPIPDFQHQLDSLR